MIRAVFGTNVLAVGAVAPAGTTPARLIDAVGDGKVELAVSEPILLELRWTLARPYYRPHHPDPGRRLRADPDGVIPHLTVPITAQVHVGLCRTRYQDR